MAATVIFEVNSEKQVGTYTPIINGQPGATIRYEDGWVTLPERPDDIKRSPAALFATATNLAGWNTTLSLFMIIPTFPPPMFSRDIERLDKQLNIDLLLNGEPLLQAEGYLFEDIILLKARKERKITFRDYQFLNLSQFFYLDQFAAAKAG